MRKGQALQLATSIASNFSGRKWILLQVHLKQYSKYSFFFNVLLLFFLTHSYREARTDSLTIIDSYIILKEFETISIRNKKIIIIYKKI